MTAPLPPGHTRPANAQPSVSGADRIREAIARDRGEFAPSQPVVLCGQPDGTERRADDPGWQRPVRVPLWLRAGERLAYAVQCPSCLGLRFGPVHLSTRVLIGRH